MKMKYLISSIIIFLTFLACKKIDNAYISLERAIINVSYDGIHTRVKVASNCDWNISEYPEWCNITKQIDKANVYLEIEVLSNNQMNARNATIVLYSKEVTQNLYIYQSGNTNLETLKWETFPFNIYPEVIYKENKGISRTYSISSKKTFINPSIKNQIFHGNLINKDSKDLRNLSVITQYTFNPITISAYTNGKYYYKEINSPNLASINCLAEKIVSDLPSQNHYFEYNDSPIVYTSYRHLNLLSAGNLGIDLDKIINGASYQTQEMEKKLGLIFTYSFEIFSIIMDMPFQLVKESIDPILLNSLSYINSIVYGKTALLIIETNHDYTTVCSIIKKVTHDEALSNEENLIISDFNIFYVTVNGGVKVIKGNENLIRKFISDIQTLDIQPLSFTTINLADFTEGCLNFSIELN